MRILKLRLSNLNSLSGAWEIDFTHPEYVNEGLFAITGATGAGKTTLLDAICLALYGQTPRLGRITKSDNDIMSRQHGDCWAEVCFATEQGEYRARWYQHRARRAPEGALQQAQHTLSELESGTIIEESISTVPARVETLSGLNFDRFMRSMMLAQGQFAAFLNAKESERSELLEQLTGTDIYAQISKRVFARTKAEKDTLTVLQNRVGDIRLLSEAERGQLTAAIGDRQKLVAQLLDEKQQKQSLADWVVKLNQVRQESQQLDVERQALTKAQHDFAEHSARLEQDRKVRPYATDLKQYHYFISQQQRNQARQQELEARLKAIKPQLEQGRQHLVAAEQDQREQQRGWQHIQADLDHAREADTRIGLAERDHQVAAREAKRLQSELNELKSAQETQLNTQKECQQALHNATQWLQAHPQHQQLATQLALVERDQEAVQALETQVTEQRLQRDALRKEYKTMAAMPLADARDRAVAESAEHVAELQQKLKAAQRETEQQRLQQRFEAHRDLLEEGEACPLCGATEHPLAATKIAVRAGADLQQAEQLLASLTAQLEQAQEEHQKLKVQQAVGAAEQQRRLEEFKQQGEQCNRAMQEADASQHKIIESWAKRLQAWQLQCELEAEDSPQVQLQQISDLLEQAAGDYQQKQTRHQTLQQQVDQSEQRLTHFAEQVSTLQARINAGRDAESTAYVALQQAMKERERYFSGRPVREVERAQQQALENASKILQKAQQENQKLSEKRVELESEQRHVDDAQADLKLSLEATRDRLNQALSVLDIADIETLAKGLLDDREQQRLIEQADKLKAWAQELERAQQRNQQDIATASDRQPSDPALNQQRLAAIDTELNDLQRRIGALSEQQRQDTEAQARYQQVVEQITAQQAVYDNWATLDGMIGSADGKKYRNFAQGLTFEIMIDYANEKLQKMSDRYLLLRDADAPLALNVIDDYQGGESRSTRNLSGGESFIVSLALALGLAQMASSRVRVDSLFLDEGFGTLDPDTLDVALDTLASLRQDGKMIGLISHVGALKERIATQLQVDAGAAGRSTLRGPGVREIKRE